MFRAFGSVADSAGAVLVFGVVLVLLMVGVVLIVAAVVGVVLIVAAVVLVFVFGVVLGLVMVVARGVIMLRVWVGFVIGFGGLLLLFDA